MALLPSFIVVIKCIINVQAAERRGAMESKVQSQLSQYLSEVRDNSVAGSSSAFEFWQQRQVKYDKLAPMALDTLVAPASQAFVERYSAYVDC